jgi:nucleoside transporter
MNSKIRVQLSAMMFLEFFIWGVWFVTMGNYLGKLGFTGLQIGGAYGTTSWAAFLAPFFVGMVADRFFSAQKVLGVLHLVGAALLYWASRVTAPGPFFFVLLAYAMAYMPTLALVNAVAFNQMKDPGTQFPGIRVWGTLGWIVSGLVVIGYVLKGFRADVESTSLPMVVGAGASLVLGVYSFFLPATPPKSSGKRVTVRDVLGLDALALLKDRSYAALVVSSLLISIPLAWYYAWANRFLNETGYAFKNPARDMTLGQVSEILFLLLMPFFFRRLGVKKIMIFGMLAWSLRYVCFANAGSGGTALIFAAILLHGVCYDFFFVTGQIYVDKKAPREIRAGAQGFISMMTYGLGMLIGNYVAGATVDRFTTPEKILQWKPIWYAPAAMAFAVAIAFALAFKEE